jgi:very-short-patch-repair endonuclease
MGREARIARARELRVEATDVERKLWSVLRGRQLGGAKFRRQYPIDRYFADFACVEAKLIVELDGGQHDDQAAYDARRTETLRLHGWKVVRFWNNEVTQNLDGVAYTILCELNLRVP